MIYSRLAPKESNRVTEEEMEFFSERNGSLAELIGDTCPTLEELKPILLSLPRCEMDLILLKIGGKTQVEIASALKVTQGAISHRLKTIARRIKYLIAQPKVPDFEQLMASRFDNSTITMCKIFVGTQNQRLTSQILQNAGVPLPWVCRAKAWSQIVVRYLWKRVLICCRGDVQLQALAEFFEFADGRQGSHPTSFQPCSVNALPFPVRDRLASVAPWLAAQGLTGMEKGSGVL